MSNSTATNLIELGKHYGLALWRRAWFVLLLAVLGAAAGTLYSRSQTPMYSSSMRVMVSRPLQEQASDLTRFMTNQQIVSTYAQLGQTVGFSQKVVERAGVVGFVSVFAMPEAQFIVLTAQTPNPQAAVPLLNTGLEVLSDEIREAQLSRYAQLERGLTLQIDNLAEEMNRTQAAINARYDVLVAEEKARLEDDIFALEQQQQGVESGSREASQIQTRLQANRQAYAVLLQTNRVPSSRDAEASRLERTLAQYQTIYSNLNANRQNVRLGQLQGTPSLIKVEEPFEPRSPFVPRTRRNVFSGGLIGLGLAVGLVLALEFLSDTLKPGEALRNRLRVPVLGQIPPLAAGESLPVARNPRSPEAESFRALRTNLAFSAIDRPLRVLLLTSPQPLTGQAAVAANLAAVFSQSGRKVLLVDANLRRPDVHKQLDLHNRLGLSDVMRELEAPLDEFLQAYRGENGVAFSVLSSGSLPPNPMEILSSTRMGQLLQAWLADFEVVIVNAPALGVPDAQVLATHADGVLLLGEVGRTRVGAVQAAIEKLLSSRARVLGVVLDQVNEQPRDYYRRR